MRDIYPLRSCRMIDHRMTYHPLPLYQLFVMSPHNLQHIYLRRRRIPAFDMAPQDRNRRVRYRWMSAHPIKPETRANRMQASPLGIPWTRIVHDPRPWHEPAASERKTKLV